MVDTRIALRDVRGPLEDLLRKLSGDDGEKWLRATAKMLRGENPWEIVAKDFAPWKSVQIGAGLKTGDDFRAAIKQAGMKIGDWANDILGKPAFTVATEEITLDLVRPSVADLGFPKGATRKDIYNRAQDLGLGLCPAEVGPQLRLQYPDQPAGEWLFIGMEPIAVSDGGLSVFRVERDGDDRWLHGSYGHPGDVWSPGGRWVFVRRK